MKFTHVNFQSTITQWEILIIGNKGQHTRMFTCFCYTRSLVSSHNIFTVTNRWQDFFSIERVDFHRLSTWNIFHTVLQECCDSIIVRRLGSHILAVIRIKISIINTSYLLHILKNQSIGGWNIVNSITFFCLLHIFIIDFKGTFQFSISHGITIWFWIDFFLNNITNDILNKVIMSTRKDIVSLCISVLTIICTVCQTASNQIFQWRSRSIKCTHNCITKVIIHGKGCTIMFLIISIII